MKKLLIKLQNKILADGNKKNGLVKIYINNNTGELICAKNLFCAKVYGWADGKIFGYKPKKNSIVFDGSYLNKIE